MDGGEDCGEKEADQRTEEAYLRGGLTFAGLLGSV